MMAGEGEGHIALQVGQAPDTDLERQIAEMKRRWLELQQVLSSTAPSPSATPDTSTSTQHQRRHEEEQRPHLQQPQSSGRARRSSARKPSSSSSSLDSTKRDTAANATTTPHLLVEGKDEEADGEQHQQDYYVDNPVEEEANSDDEDVEEEDDDEEDSGSDKARKRTGKRKSNNGGRRGRMSYSYNVDDRKAWRKRQVGIDGLTDEERWTQRMSELEAFKQRFGHVNVPQKWHENQKLANWLKNVRQRWTHVPNYLTPDKELILAELGVKKCEPLDVIIAKAKGRSNGKRKRRSSSGSAADGDDLESSDGGSADGSGCEASDASVEAMHEKISMKDEKDGDDEETEGPVKKKRRSSAPEPRQPPGATQEAKEEQDRAVTEQDGLRRSGRKRKPLFDLEHLDLVQRQQLHDHQHHQTQRSGGRPTSRRVPPRSTETSPLPPDGNDE